MIPSHLVCAQRSWETGAEKKGAGEAGGSGDAGKSGKELASAGIPRGGGTMTQGLGGVVLPWRATFTSKSTSHTGDVVQRTHPLWASFRDCKEGAGQREMS